MENIVRNLRMNQLHADVLLLEQNFDIETLFEFVTERGPERTVNELVGRYLFTRAAAEIVCDMAAMRTIIN
jgi:hypothetical protein